MIFKEDDGHEYVEVDFQMRHERCWTEITDGLNVNIHTVSSNVHKDNNYIYGTVEIKAESEREFSGDKVDNFREKPELNHYINAGLYYVKKSAFEAFFRKRTWQV